MRKLTSLFIVFITLLSFAPKTAKADHCAGAELLYEWVSDSTYRIYWKFYRDCAGIDKYANQTLCVKNRCDNYTATYTMLPVAGLLPTGVPNGSEIQLQCPGTLTTCAGGTVPGFQEWWYTTKVTLPSRCNYWEFSASVNARNLSITNLALGGSLWVDATLDNFHFQGDSSPYFSVKPVPYICDGAPYTYNNGAVDINNDSLYFTIEYPSISGSCTDTLGDNLDTFNNAGIPLGSPLYNLFNNPLQCNNTFTFNHRNGQMSFVPAGSQNAVLNVLVNSYRNGMLIGHVMRDIQLVVRTCPNQQPYVDVNTTTITGGVIDPNGNITTCAGGLLTFNYLASSADTAAVLAVSDNHDKVTPGASVVYSNYGTDSVTGTFTWTPKATDTGFKVFTITVNDSTCRPPGIILSQTYTLPIVVLPQTIAFHDTSICQGDTVHLLALGGSNFTWTATNGSGSGSLSCTNCNNPVAQPTVTTQYVVTSDLNSICKNKDTVDIKVVPALVVTVSPDTTTCVHDSVMLSASVTTPPGVTYNVRWAPAASVSSPSSLSTYVTPLVTTKYYITVSPVSGGQCTKVDTVNVRVLQGFTLFNHDTAICKGDSVTINLLGESAYTYSWTPTTGVSDPNSRTPIIKPDTSLTYSVRASYPGCSDSVASFHIDRQPYPTVYAGIDRVICVGDTAHLSASATPTYTTYTYSWSPAGSVDSPNKRNTVFRDLNSKAMIVTAKTSAGCAGADTVFVTTVKVNFLHISPDTSICPHTTVQVHITGDSLKSFYWHSSSTLSDVTNANPYVSPITTTAYTVYGLDSTNCRDTATVYVSVKPAATISLPDTVTLYPGQSYQMSPLTNCLTFSWSPATGLDTTNISNPTARPENSIRYHVTGVTEGGCVTTDSIEVLVAPDSYIEVANAFSPGTGPNSVLKVLHLGEATLKSFTIYNRWGTKVFESNDINKGWDGTLNGQPQPLGVYIYIVEAQTFKGKRVYKQGNITLLR